jgi:hypothetical protein
LFDLDVEPITLSGDVGVAPVPHVGVLVS